MEITLNKLLSSLGYSNDFLQAFADDLVVLIRGFCKSTLRDIAQSTLNKISAWCHSNGLILSYSTLKTKVVLFTRKKDANLPTPILVDGISINPSSQVVYLGFTLDSKLTWSPPINNKVDKGTKTLFCMQKPLGKTWVLSPNKAIMR